MFTFLVILTTLLFILLIIVAAMRPARSTMSMFELERRAGTGDKTAVSLIRRDGLIGDIVSLQRVATALLLVVFVILSVTTFGWLIGTIIAIIVALEYGAAARAPFIPTWAQLLYGRIEPSLLAFIERVPFLFTITRTATNSQSVERQLDSREELQHLVDTSGAILTPDERKLVVHSLSFGEQLVSSVMTPKSVIDTINKTEFLGPLTLNDVHKLGHSRLPVIDKDIDHIVGILHLKNLLALDVKRSVTAEKAMEPKVHYIREDQTLQHSLAAFLRTHHHLFIVVNEYRETVGLITLEDVTEALLGRKIIDEFDAHDDLRVVALRNPRDNNTPEKREDV